MAKKHFSVIIVPHSKTSHKTFSVSHRAVKTAVAGSGLFVVLVGAFLVDYVSMNFLRHRYRLLVKETAVQQEKIAGYEASVNRMKATISRFEEYAKKLNVWSGMKAPDVIGDAPGLGGGSGPEPDPPPPASGPQVSPPSSNVLAPGAIKSLSDKAESLESNLNTLTNYFQESTLQLSSRPSIFPAQGYLVSAFGYRADPFTGMRAFHYGVDITTQTGNPIVATADGIVLTVVQDKFLGKHVIISHGFGFTTIYGHMSAFKVRPGQKVKRGDVIGLVGMTGKAVGPHVHYEVRMDGKQVNPYNYLLEEH